MPMPLEGVTVLDITQGIDGPYCTKLLADNGADVIKIEEPPFGDVARRFGPFPEDVPHREKSGLFLFLNTSKRGVTLDLKTPEGQRILKVLAQKADIIVENLGPGVMQSLGLDLETLQKDNPQLVMTSISDFGSSGPYKSYKATDMVATAMAGYMSQLGDPDKAPLQPGVPVGRFVTGLHAAFGTILAFYGAEISGYGQAVDVSMHEALTSVLIYDMVAYSYTGRIKRRPAHSWAVHHGIRNSIQPTKDGYIGFLTNVDRLRWEMLWEVLLGRPEVLEDPRFATPESQVEHMAVLEEKARPWLLEHTSEEIFHMAQELRLPFADVLDTSKVFHNEHLRARGYFTPIEHPEAGTLEYPGLSFHFSKTPGHIARPAPMLGQHNQEIYQDLLGFSKQDMVRLRSGGVV